jgi:hypothetical protein
LCHGVPPLFWVNNNREVFYTIRVKETTDKKKRYFFIGGPLFFFYKRQSEAIHYYESFFTVSDDPGYEMSRHVGELPRSGFVHIENIQSLPKIQISLLVDVKSSKS